MMKFALCTIIPGRVARWYVFKPNIQIIGQILEGLEMENVYGLLEDNLEDDLVVFW
jgi:hypothetical protein